MVGQLRHARCISGLVMVIVCTCSISEPCRQKDHPDDLGRGAVNAVGAQPHGETLEDMQAPDRSWSGEYVLRVPIQEWDRYCTVQEKWGPNYDLPADCSKLLEMLERLSPRSRTHWKRAEVIQLLGWHRCEKAVPALTEILREALPCDALPSDRYNHQIIQDETIRALGRIGDGRAVEKLITFSRRLAMQHEHSPNSAAVMSHWVFYGHGSHGSGWDPLADGPPKPLFWGPQPGQESPSFLDYNLMLRHHLSIALLALGQIGSTQAVPFLISCVEGPGFPYQEEAAVALGQIGDARALPKLRRIIESAQPDSWLSRDARTAVAQIESQGKGPEQLIADLKSPEPALVYFAIKELERRRIERAIPRLQKMTRDLRIVRAPRTPGADIDYRLGYVARRAIARIGKSGDRNPRP